MKKHLTFMTIAAIATAMFIGCKKDNSNIVAKSKTQLLTEKTWKQVKFEERTNTTDPWNDITATYQTCELDDVITFTSAGAFTQTEGATKCSSSDPDLVESGNWSFQSNETIIRFSFGGSTDDATIETLDANTLKFSFSDPSVPEYLRVTMGH